MALFGSFEGVREHIRSANSWMQSMFGDIPPPSSCENNRRSLKQAAYEQDLEELRKDVKIVHNPKEKEIQLWMDQLRYYQDSCSSQKDFLGSTTPLLALVIAFCGRLEDLAWARAVNRKWNEIISSDKPLWKWCVRWGSVSENVRPEFWMYCTGATAVPNLKIYRTLIKAGTKTDFKHQIIVDVGRTFNCGSCHIFAPEVKGKNSNITYEDMIESSIPEEYMSHVHHRGSTTLVGQGLAELNVSDRQLIEHKRNMQRRLTNILLATAIRHPEIGYCQGMNYVVAGLYVSFAQAKPFGRDPADRTDLEREQKVLALFNRLLWRYGLLSMYKPGLKMLQQRCWQFSTLLGLFFPEISDHMNRIGMVSEMFVVGWFQTVFMYMDAMPYTTVRRIWDIFFFERSWKILFRVSLALLKLVEDNLLLGTIETNLKLLERYPQDFFKGGHFTENCTGHKNIQKTFGKVGS